MNSDSTSGHYTWAGLGTVAAGTGAIGDTPTTAIVLNNGQSSGAANSGTSGSVQILAPGSAVNKNVTSLLAGFDTSGTRLTNYMITGAYTQTSAVTTLQILASSGNLTSGTVRCYGLSK
jgi:hypothetical protein